MRFFGRISAFARHPVALAVAICLIRGGVLALQFDELASDPDGYRALAANLLISGVYGHDQVPTAYRPPFYPLVLAPCLKCCTDANVGIAALHFVLGVATAWLTVLLARQWGLGGFASLAGLLVACDPILLNQSTLVMTETLAAFLAVAVLLLATVAESRKSCRFAALAGMAVGLAALCRPTFLLWLATLVVGVGWFASGWRPRVRLAGAMLLVATLTLFPWAARNQARFDWPIGTTTHGGYTLLLGNNPGYYDHLIHAPWGDVWRADRLDGELRSTRTGDELADDRREYELAWQTIRSRPGVFAYACLTRVGRLWGVLPHAVGSSNQPEPAAHRALRYAVAVWYVGLFALALVATCHRRAAIVRPPWLWGFLLVASFTAAHAVYWSDLRMRAPLMPVICVLAAAGVRRFVAGCKREESLEAEIRG